MADVANVRNPRLIKALRAALQQLPNVSVHEQCAVKGFVREHGRICGVQTAQGEMRADQVVLAAGAWSGELIKTLGLALPVVPVKGQMILYKCAEDFLPAMVLAKGRYAIPRRDGHILVGSTLEHAEFDKTERDLLLVRATEAEATHSFNFPRCALQAIKTALFDGADPAVVGAAVRARGLRFLALAEVGTMASAPQPFDPMERAFHALHPLDEGQRLIRSYPLTDGLLAMTQVWQAGASHCHGFDQQREALLFGQPADGHKMRAAFGHGRRRIKAGGVHAAMHHLDARPIGNCGPTQQLAAAKAADRR